MKAFSNYHPMVLLVYFLSIFGIVICFQNPILQGMALVGGTLFSLMLQKHSEIPGDVFFYSVLFLLVWAVKPLFSHNGVTPLFFMNGNPVTLEAVIYGAAIALMVIGFLLWCKCYSAIMTSDKFLYLFGRIIPRMSLYLSMILRFIPAFKRRFRSVKHAQKAMGLYSSQSHLDRMRNNIRVFSAMITWTIENTVDTSSAMKARGYGIKGRTNFSLFRFYARDGLLLGICAALLTVAVLGSAFGDIRFYYYPRISKISFSPLAVCVYIAFGILAFLPFAIEVKEELSWKYCVSKI